MQVPAELALAPVASSDWRAPLRWAKLLVLATVLLLGVGGSVARMDSAVVAGGSVEAESNRKTVQHLEGGIIAEILVRDGAVVKEGGVLLRLDRTRTQATDEQYRKQLAIARSLEARLLAQRDLKATIAFPKEVTDLAGDAVVGAAIADHKAQFDARRQVYLSAVDVLTKQILQAEQDIKQALSDRNTAEQQLQTIALELPNLRDLLARGLTPLPRVTALERLEQQLKGTVDTTINSEAKSREKIAELSTGARQTKELYIQEATLALTDVRKTLSDLQQQTTVTEDALKRIDIKAPVDGTVQSLRFFTLGGVIKPGDPILDIVPASDTLVVRAQVSPFDIDRLKLGLAAEVRFPQFIRYQSETIFGKVRTISTDIIQDPTSKELYYAIEITVDRSKMPQRIRERITAGMVVQTIVPTGERTILEYMAQPLLDKLAVSMRER